MEELVLTAMDTAVYVSQEPGDDRLTLELAGGNDEPTITVVGTRAQLLELAQEIRRNVSDW